MDSRQETIKKIKNLLRFHRNGLTITDISQKLRLNRNSTAKYLEILLISGDVDLNTYGPAKVYTFSRKVPISAILKFSADIILLIDNEMRVLDANESALSILEMSREDLIGNLIEKVNSPLIARLAIPDVFKEIHTSGEVQREFAVTRQNEDRHYRVRLIPTIFDNREEGVTIIGEDITEQIRFEESLMISESRYRAIVQDQTDFICRWRPGGDITFINETLSRFGGISCSAIQEQSIFSFVSPEDHPLVKEKIAQLTPGNPTISSELRLRDRNGSYCWHLWSTRGIYDDTGTLVECQSVGRDISEVKQVEAALHKSEQLYRNILENIQDIYYRCDMDGKIVMISPSGPALMGYDSVEEIIGLNIAENFYLYPEDRKKFLETLYREQKVNDCEVTLKKRDGSPVYVSTNSQIFYDPSGNETYIEGFIRDITLRKRDEEALRESEQKFRSLVEQTFDAILILDLIGTILFANNAAARIVEAKDSAGLIGRNVMEFVAPECREEVIRDFVEVSKGHDSYLTYYHATSETGKKIYLECIGKVISYEGKPADLVSIRDITEQKKAEAVLRQSEENFRTVLENLPDLVLVHRNGIIIYVNPLMVRTLGIAP
ncbi:MAG: PAS domain S-box protein, partial [Deltaproteobacteria bacterium]|nr:PAS domain S-box protein [Deltaproteobacteria bacterium]